MGIASRSEDLHPVSGDIAARRDLMSALGAPTSDVRNLYLSAPLAFSSADAKAAFDEIGANCGPGALAAALGVKPLEVARAMPEFAERGYTTEIMMAGCLRAYGAPFSWDWAFDEGSRSREAWPDNALVRVAFGSGDPMSRLRRSHWVLTRRGTGGQEVFDINAMRLGGWVSKAEWDEHLSAWIGKRFFGGDGRWANVEFLTLLSAR